MSRPPSDLTADMMLALVYDSLEALDREVDLFHEGDLRELGHRKLRLDAIGIKLIELIDSFAAEVAARMPEDTMIVPGLGRMARERKTSKAGGRPADARRDAKAVIIAKAALDPATGATDGVRRWVAERTWELIDDSISLGGPKVKGFEKLGLNAADYSATHAIGWKIKVEEGIVDSGGAAHPSRTGPVADD